jgi:hypothetical protein
LLPTQNSEEPNFRNKQTASLEFFNQSFFDLRIYLAASVAIRLRQWQGAFAICDEEK